MNNVLVFKLYFGYHSTVNVEVELYGLRCVGVLCPANND